MPRPLISLEAALGRGRVIGAKGQVPWSLPDDSHHWRDLVKGHAIIVGAATYKAQGTLEDSYNVVVGHGVGQVPKGQAVESIEEAIEVASQHEHDEIFVVGGASIFEQTIDQADKLYLTLIDVDVPDGDRFFPEYENDFEVVSETEPKTQNGLTYRYLELVRKR